MNTEPGPSNSSVDRRTAMAAGMRASGVGVLGITALALPSAPAAASDSNVAGPPASSLVFDLDASDAGEASTTVWQDRSGNANNGVTSATGVTYVAATASDPAHFRLDGTATVPIKGGALLIDPAPSGYTKMVWFRRDRETLATDNLVSSGSTGAVHYLYFREPAPHQLLTAGHNSTAEGDYFQASGAIGAGVWTFCAATFSTTDGFRLYINTDDRGWSGAGLSEIAEASDLRNALIDGMSFEIGGFKGGNRFFGDIACVVVHSRALTLAEVQAYYTGTVDRFHPPASSLVAHLDATQPGAAESTRWADLSGEANDAVLGTGVSFVAAAGAVPPHYSFPGTDVDQRTTVGSGPIVGTASAAPTAYTKMVWFRRDTLDKTSNLASSPIADDRAAHFLYFPAIAGDDPARSKAVTGHNTQFTRLASTNRMTAATWTFLAATFSTSSGFALYLNTDDLSWAAGTVDTSAYDAAIDALTLPLAIDIGAFGGSAVNALDGDVAALVVHARALSATEIKAYHAATLRRFYPV